MKKIAKFGLMIVLLLVILFSFAGCDDVVQPVNAERAPQPAEASLVRLEKICIDDFVNYGVYCYICYDKETKVMYMISYVYNAGVAIEVMVNEDGSPRLWEQ